MGIINRLGAFLEWIDPGPDRVPGHTPAPLPDSVLDRFRNPKTDEDRMAVAVLQQDYETAYILADLILETRSRIANIPAGLTFAKVKWPNQAYYAFRDLGIRSFETLLATDAQTLLRQNRFGPGTLRKVRAILASFGLALKGDELPKKRLP